MKDTAKTIGQIIEGHGNNLLSKAGMLPEDMEAIAKQRMDICEPCENFTLGRTCKKCGCFMPAKTKAIKATCPIGKW